MPLGSQRSSLLPSFCLEETEAFPRKYPGGASVRAPNLGLMAQSSSRGPKAATVHLEAFSSSSWNPCPSLGPLSQVLVQFWFLRPAGWVGGMGGQRMGPALWSPLLLWPGHRGCDPALPAPACSLGGTLAQRAGLSESLRDVAGLLLKASPAEKRAPVPCGWGRVTENIVALLPKTWHLRSLLS